MIERKTILGVFDDRVQAHRAIEALKRAGFTDQQIGMTARDDQRVTAADADTSDESYAGEGGVAGLAAGTGVGALWGLGIVAGVLPAIGPAIAGGTLAAILSSAAAGAAAAGLAGTLAGMGIPKEEAEWYESEFRSGRVIVTVRADGRQAEAISLLRQFGGYDLSTRQSLLASEEQAVQPGSGGTEIRKHPSHTIRVPVSKEQIQGNKPAVND